MYETRTASAIAARPAIDEGLRAYMLGVYNYMGGGLAVSGLVAALIAWTGMNGLFFAAGPKGLSFTALGWIGMLAPLGMLLVAMFTSPHTWSAAATKAFYWVFTALQGVGLSVFFQAYTSGSLVRAFFVTAAAFAGLSLYGYTTKRDLTGLGTICLMGLIGLILASLFAAIFGGGLSQVAVCVIGVLLMAGLTAYDTQKIKESYIDSYDRDGATKAAVWGALDLYLDALLMFKFILQLTGDRD